MEIKICTKCKEEKSLSEFNIDRRNPQNIHSYSICKKCRKLYYSADKKKVYGKRYRTKNKDKIRISFNKNKEKYREKRNIYLRQYRQRPYVKQRTHERTTTQEYRDRVNNRRLLNLAIERKKVNEYSHKRKQIPEVRILRSLRARLQMLLKKNNGSKSDKMISLIGCTVHELRMHLESLWQENMSWENYGFGRGKWVIDHIFACAKFNLINPEEQKKCFNYKNLQPLWWEDNASKSDK